MLYKKVKLLGFQMASLLETVKGLDKLNKGIQNRDFFPVLVSADLS